MTRITATRRRFLAATGLTAAATLGLVGCSNAGSGGSGCDGVADLQLTPIVVPPGGTSPLVASLAPHLTDVLFGTANPSDAAQGMVDEVSSNLTP